MVQHRRLGPQAASVNADESPLEQAWSSFGGDPLSPKHGWQKTRCVLHDERRASATVNVDLGKWSCFAGCGRGDVYDLIGAHEGLPEFLDQKAYAEEHGWHVEDEALPEPSLMNPRPKSKKGKGKQPWKPSWL